MGEDELAGLFNSPAEMRKGVALRGVVLREIEV